MRLAARSAQRPPPSRHGWVRAVLVLATVVGLMPACSHPPSRDGRSSIAVDSLPNGLPRSWIQVWRYAFPDLAPDSLRRSGSGPFRFDSGWAGPGRFAESTRSRALIEVLSPDSVHSLDFDTYLDFDRGPDGGIQAEREPDSRAVLADFRSDSAWVVDFCGTSCLHDGAYWAGAEHFALTGATQTGEQADGPWCLFLDLYDLGARLRTRWLARTVTGPQFDRYMQAEDSALAARLERAGFGQSADSTASTRVGFPTP